MVAIERDNPSLKGVLPKDYARPHLDKQRLGELIDLVATIGLLRLRGGCSYKATSQAPSQGLCRRRVRRIAS